MVLLVHVANDLAHYTANFGPLRPGDLLLLIDTIEKMTTRMRIDLKTIPTVDQRRAVITQVVQVCPKKLPYLIFLIFLIFLSLYTLAKTEIIYPKNVGI